MEQISDTELTSQTFSQSSPYGATPSPNEHLHDNLTPTQVVTRLHRKIRQEIYQVKSTKQLKKEAQKALDKRVNNTKYI